MLGSEVLSPKEAALHFEKVACEAQASLELYVQLRMVLNF